MTIEQHSVPVSFYVPPSLKVTLDVAAREKGIGRSEMIRLALIQYLIREGMYPSETKGVK